MFSQDTEFSPRNNRGKENSPSPNWTKTGPQKITKSWIFDPLSDRPFDQLIVLLSDRLSGQQIDPLFVLLSDQQIDPLFVLLSDQQIDPLFALTFGQLTDRLFVLLSAGLLPLSPGQKRR